jgi:hypothetical protein
VITTPWQAPAEEEDEGIRPLPDRLLSELTAYRTLALRDAVARNPDVALTALLHRLVSDTFHHRNTRGCLQASVQHVYLPSHAEGLNDSPAAQSIAERHEGWEADLPGDDAALWDWIAALDSASRLALLAHCVSYGVNALYEKPNPYSASGVSEHGLQVRLAQADRLVRATSLDMADAGWRPTVANYLGRVTKAQILEAVREGAGEARAKALEGLKKDDMAREAEQLLAGTGWLPEPLRVPGGVSEDGPDADQADIAADDDAESGLARRRPGPHRRRVTHHAPDAASVRGIFLLASRRADADRGHQRRGDDRPDPGDRPQVAAVLLDLPDLGNFLGDRIDAMVKPHPVVMQIEDDVPHPRRDLVPPLVEECQE